MTQAAAAIGDVAVQFTEQQWKNFCAEVMHHYYMRDNDSLQRMMANVLKFKKEGEVK